MRQLISKILLIFLMLATLADLKKPPRAVLDNSISGGYTG